MRGLLGMTRNVEIHDRAVQEFQLHMLLSALLLSVQSWAAWWEKLVQVIISNGSRDL